MRTSRRRPALPALALLVALGPVAACGQTTAPPAPGSTPTAASTPVATTGGPASSTEQPAATDQPATTDAGAGASASATGHGVRLDATFAIGFPEQPTGPGMRKRPGVTVTYTLTRDSGGGSGPAGDLVAYDVVPDGLGSATLPAGVNPEHAWVYADGTTIRISKQGFATAPGIAFAAAPTMGVRPIPADAPLEGRAYAVTPPELALPGAEFVAPRTPLPAASSSFAFCVQVGGRVGGMRASAAGDGVLQAPVRAPEERRAGLHRRGHARPALTPRRPREVG